MSFGFNPDEAMPVRVLTEASAFPPSPQKNKPQESEAFFVMTISMAAFYKALSFVIE